MPGGKKDKGTLRLNGKEEYIWERGWVDARTRKWTFHHDEGVVKTSRGGGKSNMFRRVSL